jgi:NAD(P)-dependent dehydrogenase (short-subunit alcohol dehydrogenase family)
MGRFSGKTAIVTGAGQGLGRRIACELVKEGARVMALGRTAAKLEVTAQRAAAIPGDGALVVQTCDIGAPDQVEQAFVEAGRSFGKLDILINNAAIFDFFKITEASIETLRAAIDANLFGALLCARAAVPLMIKAGAGDIVNVSSVSASHPRAYLTLYGATKAALENLSQGLSAELAPDNIRVMALRLGAVGDDERAPKKIDEEVMRRFRQENGAVATPVGLEMRPETVVKALIDLLCLDRDAAYGLVELKPSGLRSR